MKRRDFLKLTVALPVISILPIKSNAGPTTLNINGVGVKKVNYIERPQNDTMLYGWADICAVSRMDNETDDQLRIRIVDKMLNRWR